MKIFSSKKGTEAISNWIFWMLFAVAVAAVSIIIVNISNISVEQASKIPPNLEDKLILASRFYNSEKCFAYQDKFERVHTKVIDKRKFIPEKMNVCFPESDVKYAFSVSLEKSIPQGEQGVEQLFDPIQTSNWVESGSVTKLIEEVLIFDNDIITRGTLIIEIKNVK